ncbi:MAG TPA: lamin tail domain-containing protein [Longimicrobium sp.]|nr:lamin tail domain-containing protein [Longimicrobium sp.]
MHFRNVVLVPGLALLAACADDMAPLPSGPSSNTLPSTIKLVINEVMADPGAVGDDVGEWLEVHNWGSSAVSLQGWTLASGNDAAHAIATSVSVPAGGYAVLARNGTKSKNGGVTAAYAYGTGINLANASDWVRLRDATGATVDSVAWTSMPAGATRGVRNPSLDNTAVGDANWQTSTTVFGKGDKGTPGAVNNGYQAPAQPVATVTVTPASASVEEGGVQHFAATARDAGGAVVPATLTWSSSSTAVATVDGGGVAVGVSAGSATIRATAANGVYAEASLTVTAASGGGGTSSELVVRVLDVGQGDANLITNGGSTVLIDGGPSESRMGVLLDSLGMNNDTIDVVILSHQHADHLVGLQELFRASRNITVRYFYENKDVYSGVSLAELRDSVTARAARGQLVYRDTDDPCGDGRAVCTITMQGGARLHVMRPDPGGSTPNNRSTPVKLVGPDSASFSMWFAGDAEHAAIEWFDTGANYDVFPGMDVVVLKADHHGSCNGVRSRYVELLTPDWVTFSLSATNSYGHVHTQTKALFSQYARPWYRTDTNGTVTIRSPGTPDGGYTITAARGSASGSGAPDRASADAACTTL